MRAREFLIENTDQVSGLKSQIISQVKKTQDADLLQKIYTVLNKTGLVDRIGLVLDRDTDTKGYVKQLVDMIIDVPGSYEEKAAFVKGYPNGYIDIGKMLSGEYVRFKDLIKGESDAPIKFIQRVFDSLKQVTFGGAKGPGEFALAVLSPHIKITGKGDLNIGDKVIEVKAAVGASGGRVGTPGLLRYDNIPKILSKYLDINTNESLNLKQLSGTMKNAGLDENSQTKLCTELFTYIFDGKTDISDVVSAVVAGEDPSAAYLRANYALYQEESKFTGMMLINFPAQSLKYFLDPIQMAQEINAIGVYLISSNPGFKARMILSQVTLRPVKEPTGPVEAKAKIRNKKQSKEQEPINTDPEQLKKQKQLDMARKKYANALKNWVVDTLKNKQITDPTYQNQILATIDADLASGKTDLQNYDKKLVKKFPELA